MLGNLHCRVDRYYIGQIYSGDLLQKFASFSQYMNFNGLYFEIIFESVCIKIGSFFICRGSAATSGRTPMKNFNIGLLKPSILPPYLWYCPNQQRIVAMNMEFNFKNKADFSYSLDYQKFWLIQNLVQLQNPVLVQPFFIQLNSKALI